jgi:hypothetical protein
MKNYPADHPIWTIVQHLVYGVLLIVFIYLNASDFDSTEWKTIAEIAGAVIAYKTLEHKLKKSKETGAKNE